jgi:hypothetical protein
MLNITANFQRAAHPAYDVAFALASAEQYRSAKANPVFSCVVIPTNAQPARRGGEARASPLPAPHRQRRIEG